MLIAVVFKQVHDCWLAMSIHNTISRVSRTLGISGFGVKSFSWFFKSHIRVVNYHDIPKHSMDQFKAQIDFILSFYDPVSPDSLHDFLEGKIRLNRPGVIFTFDDGFESHATYVAEYLKNRGIIGWFFVPTAAPLVPPDKQYAWAYQNLVFKTEVEQGNRADRLFAPWDSWVEVCKDHVVASHTHDHLRFEPKVSKQEVQYQLMKSSQLIEDRLSLPNRYFCYVGGELGSYSKHAAEAIKESDVELAFTTCSRVTVGNTNPLRIERTNIESHFNLDRVYMSLSGIVDLRYSLKRLKLNSCFS